MGLGFFYKVPARFRPTLFRWGFNFFPPFRAMGGRIGFVSADLSHVRAYLPLRRRTKNVHGSMFGGALFSLTDGIIPVMLMMQLGTDYITWDKAACIKYKRPAWAKVIIDFHITDAEIQEIKALLATTPELVKTWIVDIKGEDGTIHSVVERTVYIAHKNHYHNKTKNKNEGDA